MPGSMSKADLVADLRGMLKDAVNKFTGEANEALERILDFAALDLGRVRPRARIGSITVVTGTTEYPAPADFLRPLNLIWGHEKRASRKPWASNWPQNIPTLDYVESDTGLVLLLSHPPTASQVADFGEACKFKYYSGHAVADTAAETSVKPADRHLLLIRAVSQALTELALNGISKPVQLGPGVGSMPKNGTPAALAEQLLKQFERMAA